MAGETRSAGPVKVVLSMGYPWRPQYAKGLRLLAGNMQLRAHVLYWTVDLEQDDPEFGRTVRWDGDLLGGYEWSAPPDKLSSLMRIAWVWKTLRHQDPDVIVCCGWGTVLARATLIYAILTRGCRVILYGDSTLRSRARGFVRRWTRFVSLRLLFRLVHGAIAQGPSNREFYIKYGMPTDRIADGVCPVDVDRFMSASDSASRGGNLRIGFSGKLTPRKAPDDLIRAVAKLPNDIDWTLTLVGDGVMREQLRALVEQLEIQDRVEFHGFANNSEIADIVASFDILVTPSHEDNRPVATVEGMAAGAASIVSDVTGLAGAGDIVEDGVTALVFPAGDIDQLAKRLHLLVTNPELRTELQRNGQIRAKVAAPEAWARSVADAALACAVTTSRSRVFGAQISNSSAGAKVRSDDETQPAN